MGWKGESRRHSLARKGIRTNIDKDRRLDVSTFVAKGRNPYTYHRTKLEIGQLWQDGHKAGNDYFLIIGLENNMIIGGYIDLDLYWSDAEVIIEEIVEPKIFTIIEFEDRPMDMLSGGWNLRTKVAKQERDKHQKRIKDLLKESRDFKSLARYEIISDSQYAQDVAIAYNQIYDNVKHTQWFMNAVEDELESDFKSEQRWKEKKQWEKKKASGNPKSKEKAKKGDRVIFQGNEYIVTSSTYISHPEQLIGGRRAREGFYVQLYPVDSDVEELSGWINQARIKLKERMVL